MTLQQKIQENRHGMRREVLKALAWDDMACLTAANNLPAVSFWSKRMNSWVKPVLAKTENPTHAKYTTYKLRHNKELQTNGERASKQTVLVITGN